MSQVYHIRVYGDPKAQPRPRMTKRGHAYNPPSADEWKEEIEWAVKSLHIPMMEGGVNIETTFFMPRPKNMKKDGVMRTHKKKPDIDNLIKAVYDAMTNVGVWDDDSQIVSAYAKKYYATDIREPGCIIRVSEEEEGYVRVED